MTTDLDKANARLAGMQAFTEGKHFGEDPWSKQFDEDAIELRWQWQKGWLWAQQEKYDLEKKAKR